MSDGAIMWTIGSVCSGIEAASVATTEMDLSFQWLSEIAEYQAKLLSIKYPSIRNVGDMNQLPELINSGEVNAPDIICGGTPCQAFSVTGYRNGLDDDRGNLTLKFVDIIDANDRVRSKESKDPTIIFWENVEGVLSDKTNAFGCLVSSLAGYDESIMNERWPSAGFIHGPKRNIAWRVLDAKYFGLPQQRRRLYLLAGGLDFHPEQVLFEKQTHPIDRKYPNQNTCFDKEGHHFEIFREYTDCLYSAYGTKWNGNAAAYNGSLFIVQDGRLRRFSPIECERLMGFPDDYTLIGVGKRNKTARYNSIGNSWAVPVIKSIFTRLTNYLSDKNNVEWSFEDCFKGYYLPLKDSMIIGKYRINCSEVPNNPKFSSLEDVVCCDAPEDIYISPVGCGGILRRKTERKIKMNPRLEIVLEEISSTMPPEEIEKISLIQPRGEYSKSLLEKTTINTTKQPVQSTFDSY